MPVMKYVLLERAFFKLLIKTHRPPQSKTVSTQTQTQTKTSNEISTQTQTKTSNENEKSILSDTLLDKGQEKPTFTWRRFLITIIFAIFFYSCLPGIYDYHLSRQIPHPSTFSQYFSEFPYLLLYQVLYWLIDDTPLFSSII